MRSLKKVLFFIIFYILFFNVSAQDWGRINQLTYDAEYYFMTKQIDKAITAYSQILKQLPDNANILYKIGVCYLLTEKEKYKSIPYFIEASKNVSPFYKPDSYKEEAAPPETYFLLGSAYRVAYELDKAVEAYKQYLTVLDQKDTKQKEITEHYIKSCHNASQMMLNPVEVINTSMGSPLNDDFANLNAVLSGDGNTIIYITTKKDLYNIMLSSKINGVWSKPKAITRQITSKNNFKPTSLSYDGKTLLLVEEDPFDSEIYMSSFTKGRWSSAQKLKKPINSKMNETHASLSPDGKTIYFTSDRNGGFGDLDIYFSKIDEKGKWGKPENMGLKINTMYNEETPFISPDGNRLYFSSEGHEGMGGQDIYFFNLHEPGSYPVNLGYPINSTDNDVFFYPGNSKYTGYYSRFENESESRDIYFVEIQPMVEIIGKVIIDRPFTDSTCFDFTLTNLTDYSSVAEFTANQETDSFITKVKPGIYQLTVNAKDFESFSKEITIDNEPDITEYLVEANMVAAVSDVIAEETNLEEEIINTLPDEKLLVVNEITPEKSPLILEIKEEPAVIEKPVEKKEVVIPVKKVTITNDIKEVPVETIPSKKEINSLVSVPPYIDEVVNEMNDVSLIPAGAPVTYTIQLYALRKALDLKNLKNISDISVHYASDKFFKYTWGIATTLEDAKKLREKIKSYGYNNAIIRRRSIVPAYSIQVMAGKNTLDFSYFERFDKLKVTLSKDGYYRYNYGEYATLDEAEKDLEKLKSQGHQKVFIKKI